MTENIQHLELTTNAIISIIWLVALFGILITEKIDKTVTSVLIAWALIFLQVFVWPDTWNMTSQEVAWEFIYNQSYHRPYKKIIA